MLPILFPLFLRLLAGILTSFGRSGQVCYTWQAPAGGVSTATLARQVSIPITGWTIRGGMPIDFSLEHNSQAMRNNPGLGNGEWLHSYDIRLVLTEANTKATVEWAHLKQRFMLMAGVWTPLDGFRDTLAPTAGGSFLLTGHDQIRYTFEATSVPTIHRLKTIKDKSNNTITLIYDAQGRLTQVKDPNARNVRFVYQATTGRITQVKFTAGTYVRVWKLAYDAGGRLNKVTWPTVTTAGGPATSTVMLGTNAATGNIESMTNRAGHTWQFGYIGDMAAWMQAPGNSASERTVYTPTAMGCIVADPTGVTMEYEYDGLERLVRTENGQGHAMVGVYGDSDYPWAPSVLTNAMGESWVFDYDTKGNPKKVTPAGLGTWDLTWSTKNRLTKVLHPRVTDADGVLQPFRHRTDIVYDSKLRPTTVKRYTTATTFIQRTMAWTTQGLLDTATNELGQTKDYSYDAYGNLISVATPGGRVYTWDFPDELSTAGFRRPQGSNIAGGPSADYIYDELGRLRERVQADASGAEYHYDALDRPIAMEDATGISAWSYAPQGWCDMESDGGGWMAAYGRDAAGRVEVLTEMGSFGQSMAMYTYDALGRLVSKADGGTAMYEYDAADRLVRADLANSAELEWTYSGGLLEIFAGNTGFDGNPIGTVWQVDGRLMRKTENDYETEYFYDPLGRLVRENRQGQAPIDIEYTYDSADRRISRDTNGVVTMFTYDADGLVQDFSDPFLGTWIYGWDAARQLVAVQKPGDQMVLGWDDAGRLEYVDGGQTGEELYAYDGLDRRVMRTAMDAGGVPQFSSEYRHQGIHLRREERTDGMVSAQAPVRWGPGRLESFFDIQADLSVHERFPFSDGSGARHYWDGSGFPGSPRAVYDSFGRVIQESGDALTYRWGTDAGARTEGAGGLVYSGHAGGWFEPEAGAALSGFVADDDWLAPLGGIMMDGEYHLGASGQDGFTSTSARSIWSINGGWGHDRFGSPAIPVAESSYPDWPVLGVELPWWDLRFSSRTRPHADGVRSSERKSTKFEKPVPQTLGAPRFSGFWSGEPEP